MPIYEIVNPSDQATIEAPDDDKRQQWREQWEDDNRSSTNKICQYAWSMADSLESKVTT